MTDPIITYYKPSYVGPPSIPMKQANNNGFVTAPMGMPFKPNTMSQGSVFSRDRLVYANIPTKPTNKMIEGPCTRTAQPIRAPRQLPGIACHKGKVNDVAYAAKQTLLAQHSGSDIIARRKAIAIGKGSGMQNSSSGKLSFRTQDKNTVNSALAKCRSGGCIAPPKKGARENPYRGGSCCRS